MGAFVQLRRKIICQRSNQIRWNGTVRVWRNSCQVMTFSRFLSLTPVLGFLVRNLYKTPHYPPNKTGNARELMLQRCLKGFSTTETLTHKNSEQNDYKTTKTSGSINYVTEASLSANCACQPMSTLKYYYYNHPLTCCLHMHIFGWWYLKGQQPWLV